MTIDGESRFLVMGVPLIDFEELNLGDMPSLPDTPEANFDKLLGVYLGVSNEMRFLRPREMLAGVRRFATGIEISVNGSLLGP